MQLATTTEEIWRFAGYLHMMIEADRARIAYEETVWEARVEDYLAQFVGRPGADAELADIPGIPMRTPLEGLDEDLRERFDPSIAAFDPGPRIAPVALPGDASALPPKLYSGSGAPPPLDPQTPYGILYVPGGDDAMSVVFQWNWLVDVDVIGTGFGPGDLPDTALLNTMLADAGPLLPAALLSGDADLGALLNGVILGSIHVAEQGAEPSFTVGEHVQGSGAEAGYDWSDGKTFGSIAPEAPEREGIEETGQIVQAGGNVLRNDATIVDAGLATKTMVVMGDVYRLDAVIQIIGYSDADMFDAPAGTVIHDEPTTATNIATLIEAGLDGDRLDGIPDEGLFVRVEYAEGDLIDFKTLFQRNVLRDGDLVETRTEEGIWTELHVGGNLQANSARLIDWGSYDLVVILGDYHEVNLIVQATFLVDDDRGVFGQGGGTVHGGGNVMANEATIAHRGETTWREVDDDLDALVAKLAAGADPGLDAWEDTPGTGDGFLDVLVVHGNYYDVTIVGQLNIVDDQDTVVGEGGAQEWVSTGSNVAVNTATIINVGASEDQYVGGEHYEDSMLVQAELAYDSSTTMLDGDTETLASEFVAFLDTDVAADDDGLAPASTVLSGAEDGVGSMMT